MSTALLEKPISKELEARALAEGKSEQVDFQPNEIVIDNVISVSKIGNGAVAHQYKVAHTSFPEHVPELKVGVEKILPYETRQHSLGLVKRDKALKTADDKARNANAEYLEHTTDPLIKDITEELRNTQPASNTEEFQRVTGSPYVGFLALKWIAAKREKGSGKLIPVPENVRKKHEQEANILSRLQHQNIPRFFPPFITTPKGVGYLTAYVDGTPLDALLDEEEKSWRINGEKFLPPHVTIAIMDQIYDAFGYMLRKGVLQQDVQLANFMVDYQGFANAIDLGGAQNITKDTKTIEQVVGDPHYFSPEVIARLKQTGIGLGFGQVPSQEVPFSEKGTVWSLGVLTYVLMTHNGQINHPFPGQTLEVLQRLIQANKPLPAGSLNKTLYTGGEERDLIRRALTTKVDERAAIEEMREHTQRYLKLRTGSTSSIDVLKEFMGLMLKKRNQFYEHPDMAMAEGPLRKSKFARRDDED